MEKRRKSETQVPEAIIQHIQSFLDGKEAARTTILSKSWYNAWLSRPNLVFDQRHFSEFFFEYIKFSEWSRKTLQRYRDLNLKIDSFKFRMRWSQKACYPLANELVVEAIKMGATDINFKLDPTPASKFVLPRGVLESESLIRLSVRGCKMEEGVKVGCSSLVHLSLRQVYLEGDLFCQIISRCPLIEDLKLRECKCLLEKRKVQLNLSKQNLVDGLFELHKLKTLLLEKVKICGLFFSDLLSRFPCLKDLSVRYCSGYRKIQIYSQSLESISFVHLRMILNAEFDVPNLRQFCFSGKSLLPCVSFPNSRDWESDVCISCCDDVTAKWFLNLNKLLMNLRLSKVTLLLKYKYMTHIDNAGNGNTLCLPKPLMKKLKIDACSSVCAAVFDSLLQWCRPVFVTIYWHPYLGGSSIEYLDIVYKRLMQQICTKNQDDLKEVSVGVFDRAVSRWQTVPWKSVLEDTSTAKRRRIRFHLKWGKD